MKIKKAIKAKRIILKLDDIKHIERYLKSSTCNYKSVPIVIKIPYEIGDNILYHEIEIVDDYLIKLDASIESYKKQLETELEQL